MLTELCAELKNYFLHNREGDIHTGTFTIQDGSIESLPFLQNNQHYRIVGSVFNDGVHKYGDATDPLVDEIFDGAVWAMSVPPTVIALAADIDEWTEKNAAVLASPYTSESYGVYSRTYKTGGGAGASGAFTWRDQFASRLNKYRRLSEL